MLMTREREREQRCANSNEDAWKPRRIVVRSTPRAMSASAGGETAHMTTIAAT